MIQVYYKDIRDENRIWVQTKRGDGLRIYLWHYKIAPSTTWYYYGSVYTDGPFEFTKKMTEEELMLEML